MVLLATAATAACTQSAQWMSTAADEFDQACDPIDVDASFA
jgi:hypothetical protein